MADVQPGDKILDVGSGSGWTTAILSKLTESRGYIHALELIPELVEFGRKNCDRAGIQNAVFHQAGARLGFETEAPYDRILVSASGSELPQKLLDQLKTGGKMVIPVEDLIIEITKNKDDIDIVEHQGYYFVPLL